MDVSLNNRVCKWKHRAKGMGKGNPKADAIEISYGDSKRSGLHKV
jgi:hypothetical protein